MFGYSDAGMRHESGNISLLNFPLALEHCPSLFFYLLHIVVPALLINFSDVEKIGLFTFHLKVVSLSLKHPPIRGFNSNLHDELQKGPEYRCYGDSRTSRTED